MRIIILTIALVAFSITFCLAQSNNQQKGFWVVEGNTHNSKINTFKFYNDENQLLYEETVDFEINISKKKVQKKLNELLAELVNEQEAEARKVIAYKYLACL